jgi:hypothetical protein
MKHFISKEHHIENFDLKTNDGIIVCKEIQSFDPVTGDAVTIYGEHIKINTTVKKIDNVPPKTTAPKKIKAAKPKPESKLPVKVARVKK